MRSLLSVLLLVLFLVPTNTFADGLDDIWLAMEEKDHDKVDELLAAAMKDPATKVDATLARILLNQTDDKGGNRKLLQSIYNDLEDPSPYLYSMWFTNAVTSGYGKKYDFQLDFIDQFMEDPRVNISIKAGARYLLGIHHQMSNDQKNAVKVWDEVPSMQNWNVTGVFDNTSGSGFDKDHAPISNPKPDAEFISSTNSDIKWFTPPVIQTDPWYTLSYYLLKPQGVGFAQTFVTNPADRDVILALGASGSLKVWVNDQLVFEEEEELETELDVHQVAFTLPKGENRILVQLGYTYDVGYPNFSARFLEKSGKEITDLPSSADYREYNKPATPMKVEQITHFAEDFFKKKTEGEPKNIVNYLLLADTYYRSDRFNEAVETIDKVLEMYPNNVMANMQQIVNYLALDDRTELLKQIDVLRKIDGDLVFLHQYDFSQAIRSEDYDEAEEHLDDVKRKLGSKSVSYIKDKIEWLSEKKEYQEMIDLIEDSYNMYPEISYFVNLKYLINKSKNVPTARNIVFLEKYMKKNYSGQIFRQLIEEYSQTGYFAKMEKLLQTQYENHKEDVDQHMELVNLYYNTRSYYRCLEYINEALTIAPYNSDMYYTRSLVYEAMDNDGMAMIDLRKAVHYDPNLFEAREKLRELENKKPFLSFFKNDDTYDEIEAALEEKEDEDEEEASDDNFEYIFSDKNYVLFPEGASVEHNRLAIKVNNEAGVDEWKETSIGYNYSWQRLIIETAEVVKANGQKVDAEKSYSRMVFPSLEPGDAVLIEYRLENYTGGKLAKEFWVDHLFESYVPKARVSLNIYAPKDNQLKITAKNMDGLEKETKEFDEFVRYSWVLENVDKTKYESYMPPLREVGKMLYISTVDSWKVIADWYSDLAVPQAKEDHNLTKAYNEIFEGKDFVNDYEKAKAIYNYIADNISYSSVSFRQSNYIPQTPMVTISTQLGDCKDVSTLYHTLAKKAGLKTHLVLVNTRDNGESTMQMPTTEFNHCIVKIDLPEGSIFQELTNEDIPFGTMPRTIENAQALVIPNDENDNVGNELINIPATNLAVNALKRKSTVKVTGSDITVSSILDVTGNQVSYYRGRFSQLNKVETEESVQRLLSGYFDNNLEVDEYSFKNLDEREEDFAITTEVTVEDEVKSIGGFNAVKPPLFERVMTSDAFTDDERNYPIRYWKYESNEVYETEVVVELPAGSQLMELPKGFAVKKDYIDYKLTVVKLSSTKIKVIRTVKIITKNIEPAQYADFQETVKGIVKAEDIYIAYK